MRPLAIVVFLAAFAHGDAEDRAQTLREKYEALRHAPEKADAIERWTILKQLGLLRTATARDALFEVVLRKRTPEGERLLAVAKLAMIADEPALARLARRLTNAAGPFVVAFAHGLTRNSDKGARAWPAGAGLASRSLAVQTAAAVTLATTRRKGSAEKLIAVYRKHRDRAGSIVLVHETVRALARYPRALVAPTLEEAVGHPDWRVRAAAARHDPVRLLKDPHEVVRIAAARAAQSRKMKSALAPLVDLLEHPVLRVRKAGYDALRRIGGRDLGLDPRAWRSWLAKSGKKPKPGRTTVARYHGFDFLSERAVFLIDVSGSMDWPGTKPTRLDVAHDELIGLLSKLDQRTRFNIVGFDSRARPWHEGRLQPATPRQVKQATRWIREKLTPGEQTNASAALALAFAHEEADTIFLLGDGKPNGEPRLALEVRIRAWNRFRNIAIHTIALTLHKRGNLSETKIAAATRTMQRLARLTGGDYRLVDDVP